MEVYNCPVSDIKRILIIPTTTQSRIQKPDTPQKKLPTSKFCSRVVTVAHRMSLWSTRQRSRLQAVLSHACNTEEHDSSVGIATLYGLDGPGIEPQWDEIFRTRPDRPWGPPSVLYNGYRVSFQGGKAAEVWR